MKKIAYILIIPLFGLTPILNGNGLKLDSLAVKLDTVVNKTISEQIIDEPESADNSTPMKVQKGDTTYITLGKKRIKIFDENGETNVKIEEKDKEYICQDEEDFERQPAWKNFKGHWAGISGGPNNLVDKNFSFERNDEDQFMEINPVKSWNFNVNFAQYSIGLGSDKVGLSTGLGIEWSNYHFSDTNIIAKEGGKIVEKSTPESIQKKRLQTTYLTVPLLFEVQFPNLVRSKRAYISVGVISGIKLFSNTKIKYVKDGNKQKEKFKSDYYLNSIRYGLTARMGYSDCGVYFNYYLTPLFLKDHGPELYPLAAGVVLNF
jgi:hypothetical protein